MLPFVPGEAFADDLTNSFIRLDRQAFSKTTGGLVCTTTPASDNGVENNVQLIFPSGFTVNQTASNWTVTTTDLPAGATAWPGISTATTVSGQIVTFPSSDLSSSTQYCFNFSASNTLTTPSSTGNYPGTIRTRNGSNTIIDSRDFGISIIANDGITVTARVGALPTDFQANIHLVPPSVATFGQDTELVYQIAYGSYLRNPADIAVEAEWDLGTLQGDVTPTKNILDYVVGSATNAYNDTPPVIDVLNRKITWTLSIYPGKTYNQSVYFRLKTNSSYKGDKHVAFSVHARVYGPLTQTPDSITTNTYLYNYLTTLNSSEEASAPQPTTPPAVPTLSPQTNRISQVDIRSISPDSADIFVSTESESSITVLYGKNIENLDQTISDLALSKTHLISLKDLEPNTKYYFKIKAKDGNGNITTSDNYILNTSSKASAVKLLKNSIVITSQDVQLTNAIPIEGVLPNIILPVDSSFAFRFVTENYEDIKSVKGLLRNNRVLGVSSDKPSDSTPQLTITEISPGQYVGKFEGYPSPGNYKLFLRIRDYNGNIAEQEIASIYIVNPLKIVNSLTKNGIENAKISFEYFNPRTKIYEPISPNITSIKNPNKSNFDGIVNSVLPEGKYRATITVLGYDIKKLDFEVKPSTNGYPVIELTPQPFNIITYIKYTIQNVSDALTLLNNYVNSFKTSGRYFEMVTFGVILLFIALALIQFSKVFGVPVLLLPFFAFYHLLSLFYKPKHTNFIQGKIIDISTHTPIDGVLLHFANSHGKVFAHARSNSNGDFTVSVKNIIGMKISLSKKGYSTFSKKLAKEDLVDKLTISLSKDEKPDKFGLGAIKWYFESVVGALFESFLVLTIIVEIIFAQQFGIVKALPAIVISIGNVLIWALHARPKKAVKTRA